MMEMSLKRSRKKSVTPVTSVEPSMKKQKTKQVEQQPLPFTLRVLNDLYLVEEDEMVVEAKGDVKEAIDSGRLVIPEAYKAFYEKVPYTGTVIAKGDKLKYDIPLGSRIMYGKYSCQRFEHEGHRLLIVKERDVHGIFG